MVDLGLWGTEAGQGSGESTQDSPESAQHGDSVSEWIIPAAGHLQSQTDKQTSVEGRVVFNQSAGSLKSRWTHSAMNTSSEESVRGGKF